MPATNPIEHVSAHSQMANWFDQIKEAASEVGSTGEVPELEGKAANNVAMALVFLAAGTLAFHYLGFRFVADVGTTGR